MKLHIRGPYVMGGRIGLWKCYIPGRINCATGTSPEAAWDNWHSINRGSL